MKKFAILLLLLTITTTIFAQSYQVPQNYELKTKEDYAKYESDFLKTCDWLINTPINIDQEKRLAANQFAMRWITGTPTVSLELNSKIVNFVNNSELLMIFMCGWAKYAIESKDYSNAIAGNTKGIEASITFYEKNLALLKRDKNIEKYIKLKQEGKLEEFIKKNK